MTVAQTPETSVVIRAFNEERWLPEVFSALDRQTYRSFEVILVDSGSLDRTREIAEAHGARIVRLRTEDFTFGHSLNVGIRESQCKFIAILSAHAIPADEHWLENLVEPLRNPRIAMVWGSQRGHPISKYSETRDFLRYYPDEPSVDTTDEPIANNANSAISRQLWLGHPFDEGLPGLEDVEWARYWATLGHHVAYEPKACIIHVHTESWAQVRRRYYREGLAARWVRLRILRHIPRELWQETRWLFSDLWSALLERQPLKVFPEIVRFRYEKTVGTIRGNLDSRGVDSPSRRAALYYEQSFPAVVLRGPHQAEIEHRGIPTLKPGEVLIRIGYVGICGTDLEMFEGTLGYFKSGMGAYPIVPGHECVGTVVRLGPRITDVELGERVVVECIQGCGECEACRSDHAIRCPHRQEMGVLRQDGGYAAYMVARARYLHRVPTEISMARAALTEPLAVVVKALRRLGSTGEETERRSIAVVGAGTIGQLAARVLALRGHDVTLIDSSEARLATVGGTLRTSTSLEAARPCEWLVEASGSQAALSRLLSEAATGSTVLLLGLPYAAESFSFESVVAFDRAIIGSVGSSSRDFREALALLPRLELDAFLGATMPLEKYEQAWDLVRSRKHLKVMLQVEGDREAS